jgi:hypothetical protein
MINNLIINELIGKTIKKAEYLKIKKVDEDGTVYDAGYDDEPFLKLEMEDGSIFTIIADYGGFTGRSQGEYGRFISIKKGEQSYEDN